MVKSYEEFINQSKIENPDMFEALGEDYFKKIYDNMVKVEGDYKRLKAVFDETPLAENSKLVDLDNIDDVSDIQRLLRYVKLFGQNLMWVIEGYDTLYVCPEVATFMRLSSFFKGEKLQPLEGIYKFGTFGNENFQIDCYKAPEEIAEKDSILLHSKDDNWKKVEVKISSYYKRKWVN